MGVYSWLDERLDLEPLLCPLRAKHVPRHRHSFWYILGGMALTLMAIQVVTGIGLMLYYRPTPEAAHASVQRIMAEVPGGAVVRSVHSWGASLLVVVVFVHLVSTLLMAAYRRPRELTWVTGVVMFAVVLAFGFSGYLLPWNERSYFATRVGTDMAGEVPLVGPAIESLLRGGLEVGADTLTRFYTLHVMVLPILTLVFLGGHLWLIQRLGVSTPESVRDDPRPATPFFPDFLLRDVAVGLGLVGLLATLAVFAPEAIGAPADTNASAPPGIAPEWFFMGLFQTLKLLPDRVLGVPQIPLLVTAALLVGLAMLVLPFADSRPAGGRLRTGIRVAALVLAAYLVGMTAVAVGFGAEPELSPPPWQPGAPTAEAIIHYLIFMTLIAVAMVALSLLVRERARLRRMGLFNPRTEDHA